MPRSVRDDMTKIKDLHKAWIKAPTYRKEYDALEEEFTVMAAIAKARRRAGLSQAELARRHLDYLVRLAFELDLCRVLHPAQGPGKAVLIEGGLDVVAHREQAR